MIFEFSDTVREIDFTQVTSSADIAAFISTGEFEKFYLSFGLDEKAFEKFSRDDRFFRSKTESCDGFYYGTMIIIEPDINNMTENRIAFYICKNLFLMIDISDSNHSIHGQFLDTVNRIQSDGFTPEKFIYAFINGLISSDNRGLETIELEISRIEDRIIRENEYKNFYEELLSYKIKLLKLRNYYEQLIDICEDLSENENNLFEKSNISYFRNLIKKAERLCNDVNLLRDNIVQLREIHQTSLDMKLNNTMKLFTVITAVFSPLTLIAGWYGMNFRYMPELSWKYGYVYVIILSVLTVGLCIYIFKKKKLI